MFSSQPQGVEVYERGAWLPASMLGWRHDSDGVCSAWVRVEFAGVVEDAWVELTRLRLPEPPAGPPAGLQGPAAGSARSGPTAGETQQLPLVRDGGATPARRRVPAGGGRRRAAETGEVAAAAVPVLVARAPGGVVPGRHRAPAGQGRHRAADTGVLTAVPAAPAGGDTRSVPPLRHELPPAGPVVRGQGARDLSAERLTRPMRLEEGVGSARRSRRDSLSV